MGNTNGAMWPRPADQSQYANALFHALDGSANGYLTLKDLMDTQVPGLVLPHSLPALYFFDVEKKGRLTEPEFTSLVEYFQLEKRKVEQALIHDKNFRDLILRASKAGVKDCSLRNRSSYRRVSSYFHVRSVFCSRRDPDSAAATAVTAHNDTVSSSSTAVLNSSSTSSDTTALLPNELDKPHPQHQHQHQQGSQHENHQPQPEQQQSQQESDGGGGGGGEEEQEFCAPSFDELCNSHLQNPPTYSTSSSSSSSCSDTNDVPQASDVPNSDVPPNAAQTSVHEPSELKPPCVAMYSSQRAVDESGQLESENSESDVNSIDTEFLNPQNRTAIDVAVLEKIINDSIHRLADLLHREGSREKFMEWLWELANFNSSGVVTLEELRIFLAALSEDGIDIEELAFHKEGGEPLEVSIINEFDTTHAGLLSRDEFMVLADLVTREYEFWGNRHLERIGDYELGRTIGRGSSGIVRHAFHVENRQKFAIKIIKKGKCSDLSRLDREIQSLMAAKHEHIVRLEEVLDSDDNIFIVMELCGGGSMVDIVRLYPEERMPEETARFFMRQVFEALAFCHINGICHRDVRLDNFMLDNSGNVKITDFGHSGMYTPGWDIFSTALVGSVYNLSPEQIRGQVYSGEKIDIWSAGVAIYCLLIGQPPFYDPDVNSLLECITQCKYTIPDFVSDKASDLIRCMIRAAPEERIPIHQMLHHPWFYGGPEYGPSMNVVVFPVDIFYKKRPDIAEMILAMTIYQHNLHFHLADTHNPMSTPDELRGQDWTLRCLDPRNDIKFTVSLFTKPPHPVMQGKQSGLTTRNSTSSLLPASVATISTPMGTTHEIATTLPSEERGRMSIVGAPPPPPPPPPPFLQRFPNSTNACPEGHLNGTATTFNRDCHHSTAPLPGMPCVLPPFDKRLHRSVSGCRPPKQRQKKSHCVTPMDVAAHIRASGEMPPSPDPFDLEPSAGSGNPTGWYSFQEGWLRKSSDDDDSDNNDDNDGDSQDDDGGESHDNDKNPSISSMSLNSAFTDGKMKQKKKKKTKKKRRGRTHSRSQSLDGSGLSRLYRSATIDAFPYQKVIPQRTMPDSVRNLDFGKGSVGDGEENGTQSDMEPEVDDDSDDQHGMQSFSAPMTPTFTTRGDAGDDRQGQGQEHHIDGDDDPVREGDITLEIVRHPSKTVSPQSPQMDVEVNADHIRLSVAATVKDEHTPAAVAQSAESEEAQTKGENIANLEGTEAAKAEGDGERTTMAQPFIEVRLQDGEAGLFLKICRKLKSICSSKLGELAQRRKHMKTSEGRSLTTLRRTASAKSFGSESDSTALPASLGLGVLAPVPPLAAPAQLATQRPAPAVAGPAIAGSELGQLGSVGSADVSANNRA